MGSLITDLSSKFQKSKIQKIVEFSKFHVRRIGSAISKNGNLISNSLSASPNPWSTKFHENRWVSKILCTPYWVRHFEFRKSDVKFIISDVKSFSVQSFAEIMWFPKLHVRHIGYPPFCERYGYLRSVRQFFRCSSTIPITIDHS